MKKTLLYFLMLCISIVNAQHTIIKKIDTYVNSYNDVHGFSGNIVIAKKGKIVYQKFLGQANREWEITNTPDTKFRIGSLTKQFTAAAILQLEEKGKLKTSDRLSKFFPDFPKADSITIHMLLNHTSGIRGDSGDSIPAVAGINPNIPISRLRETLISTFKDRPFEFFPGKGWSYCNPGFILLGYIIEDVSGQTFSDYIQKNIFEKADMQQSGFTGTINIIPHFASGYNYTAGQWRRAKYFPMNTGFSAGGIYSTTADLLKWNDALISGKIINAESLRKMHEPHWGKFGAGYGIFVEELYGHKIFQHQGALEGYNTFMARYPDDDLCIIVLTNKDTNLDFLPRSLAAIMFGMDVSLPVKRKGINMKSNALDKFVGFYEGGNLPFPLDLFTKDGKLYWRANRNIELVPESGTTFYINEPDIEIQFEFPAIAGTAGEVVFTEAGVKRSGKKKN